MIEFTPIASSLGGALIGLSAVLLMLSMGQDRWRQRHRQPSASAGRGGLWLAGSLRGRTGCGSPGRAACDGQRRRADGLLRPAADGHCRPAGRLRNGVRQRLHQRPRRVRHLAAFRAVYRCNAHLHGRRGADRFCHSAHRGALTMRILVGFITGLVFGLGLVISGMANPAKVLNFLRPRRHLGSEPCFCHGRCRYRHVCGLPAGLAPEAAAARKPLRAARREPIPNPRLMAGAGLGWGLSGYCPGPALTALSLAAPGTLIFVPAMLAGMWLARAVPETLLASGAASRTSS